MKQLLTVMAVMLLASAATAAPIAGVTVADYSGRLGSSWDIDKSLDGNASTFWYSNISSGIPEPYATYDLGSVTTLDSLAITMSDGNFRKLAIAEVLVSTDNVSFTSLGQHAVDVTNGTVTNIDVADTSAQYVKIVGVQAFFSNWNPQYANPGEASDGKYAISYADVTFEAVPEPATFGLLAMGSLLIAARRR